MVWQIIPSAVSPRNELAQQALKLELQKLLKDVEIKGINLTAY